MMSERRYDEDEARRIFDAASQVAGRAEEPASDLPTRGFTIAELQQIGAEAGLDPAAVAEAARTLGARASLTGGTRRMAGLPIGVSRVVNLPDFTDSDWNRLVVDLRETFDARGRVRVDGELREWSNGNLRAMVEPTDDGYRLRMRTVKGSAYRALAFMQIALVVLVAIFVGGMLTGEAFDSWEVAAFFALFGAASAAVSAVRLPAWARTRESQMEQVAERALLRSGPPPAGA